MAGALIGALRVSLSAETSAFEAGMKRSQRTAKATANSITSDFKSAGGIFNSLKAGVAGFVASLSVGTILAAGKAALDYAGSLGEVAQQLGVTTKDLQVFRYAAGQTGVSQEQLETGLSKLTITLGQVAAGAAAPAKALKAIGIEAKSLAGLDTGDAFRMIADGLEKVEDRSQRAAVEVALFGRSGAKLDNLLAGGSQALNELADAANRLGIVLSDEQIQKADDTADKLEALQTVLKAQIAGVVADNADSILELANAIAQVAAQAGQAIGKVRAFYEEARIAYNETQNFLSREVDSGILGMLGIGNKNRAANRAANDRDTASIRAGQGQRRYQAFNQANPFPFNKPKSSGGNISQFLAPKGGGGGRGRKDRSAEEAERKRLEALRDANQFDQEIRRANIDILHAKQQLATDEVERYQISVDIKDAERAAFASQLQYEVAAGERTGVQAEQLQLEYDKKDQLERGLMIAEESERARRASAEIDANTLQMERDYLESQAQLAETASERRAVQLKLLDNAYALQRLQLEEIIASRDATEAQKEIARRRLEQLEKTYANDRQAVMNDTRGPWEDYLASLPSTAAKAQEALESLQVQGIEGLIDASLKLSEGLDSAKDALLQTLKDFLLGLARMELQKGVASMFGQSGGIGGFVSSIFGGSGNSLGTSLYPVSNGVDPLAPLPQFAGGGGFNVLGNRGIDNNVMSLNGLPIAKVSYGERVSVSNDNNTTDRGMSRSGGWHGDMNIYTNDADSFRRNDRQIARAWNRRMDRA